MKSPDDHGALDPARCLEEFITPLGFPAPEMEEIEIFHETTKLKRFHHRTLGRRIGTYLVDERAVIETVNNYKVYGESEVIPLPPPAPVSATLAQIISTRKSCRSFSGEATSLEELSQILSRCPGDAQVDAVSGEEAGTLVQALSFWRRSISKRNLRHSA